MKCTARLIYYKKLTQTGKRRLHASLPYTFDADNFLRSLTPKQQSKLDLNAEMCGGKIIAEIGCHEEHGFGEDNTWAELDINFICEECKQHYHPNLPRGVEELNDWLTEIIKERD